MCETRDLVLPRTSLSRGTHNAPSQLNQLQKPDKNADFVFIFLHFRGSLTHFVPQINE